MNIKDFSPGLVGAVTGFGASLCCVAPLTIMALGLGSGAFMSVTMAYRPVLYPLGILGLGFSFYLYRRKKKTCDKLMCKMEGKRINLVLLGLSALLMAAVTYVDFFLVEF